MLISFPEMPTDTPHDCKRLLDELRRIYVPTMEVRARCRTLVPVEGKPRQRRRGSDVFYDDIIGVFRRGARTTTFTRRDLGWIVRMTEPLSAEQSRVLLQVYHGGKTLVSYDHVAGFNAPVEGPEQGSGRWLALSLEALDAICGLLDTNDRRPAKFTLGELVAAGLLDADHFIPRSS